VDQVDDREDAGQPVGQVGLGRHPVGDAGVADLVLRPHQALRHRRLGHQEGVRDLRGGQAADQPQRQRDAGGRRQGGVAAGEQHAQPVVAHGALLGWR
jgi:hypothetical protein